MDMSLYMLNYYLYPYHRIYMSLLQKFSLATACVSGSVGSSPDELKPF